MLRARPADEQHGFPGKNFARNTEHFNRRLADAEDDLRKSATPPAIDIDPRKAEVNEAGLRHRRSRLELTPRRAAQPCEEASVEMI
jgi:hypothetical protein